MSGEVPGFLKATIDQMPAEQGAELFLTWQNASVWYRSDPLFGGGLLAAASAVLGVPATEEAVDDFFRNASVL